MRLSDEAQDRVMEAFEDVDVVCGYLYMYDAYDQYDEAVCKVVAVWIQYTSDRKAVRRETQ